MSWRVVFPLAVAGCGFSGTGVTDGGPPADGPIVDAGDVIDAADPIDAYEYSLPDADWCVPPYARTQHGCHAFVAQDNIQPGGAASCAGLSGGGLPILDNAAEAVFIGETALGVGNTTGRVWIGLELTGGVGGVWTWRDGTPATFLPWVPVTEPNGSGTCVVLRVDGTIGDRACSEIWRIVCELP